MSFITKRERVFNEYDLFDLPARNEGKLKAYASCTDSRAWSHYGSDKSEHLVDIIKRNNDTCRPKYVPTDVIVNTLMGVKNSEIYRLKRKINEFEQMLAVYEQLDLTSEQKYEISNAHEEIKAANKGLDDLSLDLDLTGFTEGIDSEDFQTGKSGGDMHSEISRVSEWPIPNNIDHLHAEQYKKKCTCENSTNVTDPRIDEMHDMIIIKDAKLNAIKNTISVLEMDIRQPYCLYAHIYTALEKIFGVLCQNAQYKNYLYLLSANQSQFEGSDIKRKILEKLQLLETFSIALIIPSSKNSRQTLTEFVTKPTRVETAYALRLADIKKPFDNFEDKRADLISDIMNDKYIKAESTEVSNTKQNDQNRTALSKESLNRLKNLQTDYNELMVCYENIKKERDELLTKCTTYKDLENEIEKLQSIITDYNNIYNEKEYFKMRSDQLNELKEQFLVLSEETSNLECKLKAESEINSIKSFKITEIANENINLERRICDIKIAFEKEKNLLECLLKDADCKIMCQQQQIKNMSLQIDRILVQNKQYEEQTADHLSLLDEINALKQEKQETECQLFYNAREKQQLQEQFEEKEEAIDNLQNEIEQLKDDHKKNIEHNNLLKKHVDELNEELNRLGQVNENLAQNINDKNNEIVNLKVTLKNKSLEINNIIQSKITKSSNSVDKNHKLKETISISTENVNYAPTTEVKCQDYTKTNDSEEILKIMEDNRRLIIETENLKKNEYKLQQQIRHLLIDSKDMNNFLEKEEYVFQNQLNSKDQYCTELINALIKAISDREKIQRQLGKSNETKTNLEMEKEDLQREINNISTNVSREESQHLLQHNEQIIKLKEEYENHINKLKIIERDLLNNNNDLAEQNKEICNKISIVNFNYEQLNMAYNDVSNKNLILEDEINNIYKINKELHNKLIDQHNIEKKNLSLKESLSSLIKDNKQLEIQVQKLIFDIEEIVKDKINLIKERDTLKSSLNDLKIENNNLEQKLKHLIATQINPTDRLSYNTLYEQVESITKEMSSKQAKIQELLDTNNEYDELIKKYVETISVKDEKITILENHINKLEEEIKLLHGNLSSLLETSEEIRELSVQNLNKSMKNIENQNSQTTFDLKMEIENLLKSNSMLNEQVILLQKQTKESEESMNLFRLKSADMINERHTLLQQLHNLETESAGNSLLVPEISNTEDIVKSFTRIRESLQAGYSKTSLLEQKLSSVQTSSQVLQSKADEAKKIVEREKIKIISEKEDAIKEKHKLELQFKKLKEYYEMKIEEDNQKIKDLNGELINTKLITNNINKSNTENIKQLNEELDKLQKSYENSLKDNANLKEKIIQLDNENNKNKDLFVTTNEVLKQKLEEVTDLRKQLHTNNTNKIQSWHTIPNLHNIGIQTEEVKSNSKSRSINNNKGKDILLENTRESHNINNSLKQTLGQSTKTKTTYDKDLKFKRLSRSALSHLSLNNKNANNSMVSSNDAENCKNINNLSIVSENNDKPIENILLKNHSKLKNDYITTNKSKTYVKTVRNNIFEGKPKESSNKLNLSTEKTPNIVLSRSTSNHEVIFHKRDIIVNRSVVNKYSNISLSKRSLSLSDVSDNYDINMKKNYINTSKDEFNVLIPSSSLLNITNTEESFMINETTDTYNKNIISKNSSYNSYIYRLNNESNSIYNSNSQTLSDTMILSKRNKKIFTDKSILAKLDNITSNQEYEEKLLKLHNKLIMLEKEYKGKVEAIKTQYDNNIKKIKGEHNHGVQSLQNLHEESLQYTIRTYDNEVDNLRTLSLTAMKKAQKYNKENKYLANKLKELEKELIKSSNENKIPVQKSNLDIKKLTKTSVRAINLLEKINSSPCTCSVDINLSDAIQNIFEQVDAQQRKAAERNYINYIVSKIMSDNINTLDTRELAFLHLKVCRTWKIKLLKEQENKNQMEVETKLKLTLPNYLPETNEFIEVKGTKNSNTTLSKDFIANSQSLQTKPTLPATSYECDNINKCNCTLQTILREKSSVGDLSLSGTRPRRRIPDNINRAILVKLLPDECKESKTYHDEVPIKLKNTMDRPSIKKSAKKKLTS